MPENEHANILAAIECGETGDAEAMMIEHQDRISEGLVFWPPDRKKGIWRNFRD